MSVSKAKIAVADRDSLGGGRTRAERIRLPGRRGSQSTTAAPQEQLAMILKDGGDSMIIMTGVERAMLGFALCLTLGY